MNRDRKTQNFVVLKNSSNNGPTKVEIIPPPLAMNIEEQPVPVLQPGIMQHETSMEFKGSVTFAVKLCCALLSFIVFWVVSLLRIYLPESYWTWSYLW